MKRPPKFYVPDLPEQGYCYINRNANVVARIDRPDWIDILAGWIVQEGKSAAAILGTRQTAADTYRRMLSTDRLRLPAYNDTIPNSSHPDAPSELQSKILPWAQRPNRLYIPGAVDPWEGSDAFNPTTREEPR